MSRFHWIWSAGTLAVTVLFIGFHAQVFGETAAERKADAAERQADALRQAEVITQSLESNDASRVSDAIERIKLNLQSNAPWAVTQLRTKWLKPLMVAKRYDIVEDLALRGVLAQPWLTIEVEGLQEFRVRALLGEDKTGEALVQAKSLFNVSSMKGTEKALLLICECLRRSNQRGDDLPQRFQSEQMAGAAIQPPDASSPAASNILAKVVVDGHAYQRRLDELSSDDDRTLIGRGNLFLLADRPKEAYEIFKMVLNSTTAPKRVPFHENIARAIKAEDGTIGRANGYALNAPADEPSPTAVP
jgi:hypothetical protein